MYKSYKKMFILLIILIVFFLLNSFIFKFLSQNILNGVLLLVLLVSYFLFGFEKDRHRYTKEIVLEIFIFLISFFLLYYLSGIIIGFAKVGNYYNFKSFYSIILPLIVFFIVKEFLRYQLLCKAGNSKMLISIIYILFVCIDSTIQISLHNISFNKETFLLVAITLLPLITENVLCTYLSLKFGYKPGIIYLIIMHLYGYLIPIIPNPNEYIYSLIFFLLPIILLNKIKRWLSKDRTNAIEAYTFNKRKKSLLYIAPIGILCTLIIYGVSGYFRYFAIAVASGSMESKISKGDVVIVDQNYDKLNSKDIVAYKYENKIIVHRIFKIVDVNGEYYVYTKGDANKDYDKYKIEKDMIIGVVKFKIPFIGYPTVLLNERW